MNKLPFAYYTQRIYNKLSMKPFLESENLFHSQKSIQDTFPNIPLPLVRFWQYIAIPKILKNLKFQQNYELKVTSTLQTYDIINVPKSSLWFLKSISWESADFKEETYQILGEIRMNCMRNTQADIHTYT